MSNTIHIFKSALDDLQNALDWYDSQSNGLEQRFSKEVNARLIFSTAYLENPLHESVRLRDVLQ